MAGRRSRLRPARAAGARAAHSAGAGSATGILSVSTPGVHPGDDGEARAQARAANQCCAALVQERPDRFGFCAGLPLPDVEGALAEAAYALDVLQADGVGLLANLRGSYLGAAACDPLFDALTRRAALVVIHPAPVPGPAVPGLPPCADDCLLATTRAALNRVTAATVARCPELRLILAHAGGGVPSSSSAQRPAIAGPSDAGPRRRARDIRAARRRVSVDRALAGGPDALPSLRAVADPTPILSGSDWPFTPPETGAYFNRLCDAYPLDEETRTAIDRGNAERLVPRLARLPVPGV